MKLVVGLGNPGRKYQKTRHNVGFMIVAELADRLGVKLAQEKFDAVCGETVGKDKVVFLLPQTYMNASGRSVGAAVGFFKSDLSNVVVVHDDVDFPIGKIKLDFDASSAGHNGVQDIIEVLGGKGFYRLRVGVGRPRPERAKRVEGPRDGGDVVGYVLSPFTKEEGELLKEVIEKGVSMVEDFLRR